MHHKAEIPVDNIIKSIMSNFLFICAPLLIYFLFWTKNENRSEKSRTIVMFLCLGLSIILCLSFPYRYDSGINFDFRHIPLVLAVLYSGPRMGSILLAIVLAYRYLLDVNGIAIAALITGSGYLTIVWIKSRYTLNSLYKIMLAVFASTAVVPNLVVFCLFLFDVFTLQSTIHVTIFRIIQSLAACLAVYMIEFVIYHFRIQNKLQESEKMRVVSELAASISHEIRNPLTTVKGMLQVIGEKDYPREKKQQFIQLALSELETAINIISDFLTFSKPQLNNLQLIHLAQECNQVITILTPYANMHQVELQYSFEQGCVILGDSQKFRQSLINLVKNSIEASPNETVDITLFAKDKSVVIEIRDTGMGMTKEQVKRLGNPYYSTKEKGTGLGTMVAFSLIKAMDGSIHVNSEFGKGSSFVISFPSPK
jgi:two-component system sporulation sensor kinase B